MSRARVLTSSPLEMPSSGEMAVALLALILFAAFALLWLHLASPYTYRLWRWGVGIVINYRVAGPYGVLNNEEMSEIWSRLASAGLPGRPERAWRNLRAGSVVIECTGSDGEPLWAITNLPASPWPDWVAGMFVLLGDRAAITARGVSRIMIWARLLTHGETLDATSIREAWAAMGGSVNQAPIAASRARGNSAVTFGLRDLDGNSVLVYRGARFQLGTLRIIGLGLVHYRDIARASSPRSP